MTSSTRRRIPFQRGFCIQADFPPDFRQFRNQRQRRLFCKMHAGIFFQMILPAEIRQGFPYFAGQYAKDTVDFRAGDVTQPLFFDLLRSAESGKNQGKQVMQDRDNIFPVGETVFIRQVDSAVSGVRIQNGVRHFLYVHGVNIAGFPRKRKLGRCTLPAAPAMPVFMPVFMPV